MKLQVIILTSLTVLAPYAYSADAPNLQNTVERYDPGKAAAELSEPDLNKNVTPAPNVVNIKGKHAPVTDEATVNIKFKLKKIILFGNTVFSTAELEKLYADKLNTDVSLADLEQIAHKITEYYRNAGYVLTQAIIPPQEINQDGVVKIRIVEGYINKVSVVGCKNANVCHLIREYGDRITRKSPLKLEDLERYSFLANDIPGVKARAVLTKSQDFTGAADLTFIVDEKKAGGFIAYNDYNPTVLGRQQLIGNIYVNNLTLASETALNGITSRFDSRMLYGSFTHRQQLDGNGLGGRILVSWINTNPNMGSIGLGGLDIPGKAFTVNLAVEYPWIRSHSKNLNLGAGFKFLNSTTEFGGMNLFKDNIRSINIFASYNYMQSAATYNTITATFSQGLKIFAAQGNPPSRVGENITFSKLELFASSLHRFSISKFSSLLAMKAQYSPSIVPSSETFTYGGVPFGYGYEPSEFAGDSGVDGLLELRYQTFSIPRWKYASQIFGFFDCGFVWDANNSVQPSHQTGSSTGIGYRANSCKHINFDFIVAAPLKPSTISGTPNFVRILFNVKLYA